MKLSKSTRNSSTSLDLVDRISDLPDSILGFILSCLPTKTAVATSILSKRWKSVWMILHNLDFCLHGWGLPEDAYIKFAQFVNHVLLLNDSVLLNKFCLVWTHGFIPAQVGSWITITRKVHHLCLRIGYCPKVFEMPVSVFGCESLQSLELNGTSIYVRDAIVPVCLPRLESLKLYLVSFQSEKAFEKLISGCPILNNLVCERDNDCKYIISSSSLRCLELRSTSAKYSIELEVSSLEYLVLTGYITNVCVKGTLSSLVEADFSIRFDVYDEDTCNSVVKAVCASNCAKALSLSLYAIWAINNATISMSTKFTRLTRLEVWLKRLQVWRGTQYAGAISSYCILLQDILQNSDNLQVLAIENRDYEGIDGQNDSKCIAVEVPRCLSNSLKTFSYKGYSGFPIECEMISYMLKHGSSLEVVQVTCRNPPRQIQRKQLELVTEICSFPRKSAACKVKFIN